MIIKLLLSTALLAVAVYAVAQQRTTGFFHGILGLLALLGGYFVWFPEHTTVIANALGVGRGADLILYCWIIISLFLVVSLYLRMQRQLELITELARHVSLLTLLPEEPLAQTGGGSDDPGPESAAGPEAYPES